MRVAIFAAVLAVFSAPAQAQSASAAKCEQLAASLKLPNTTVSSATLVAAGKFMQPGGGPGAAQAAASLPAFCRVALTIKPTSDSDIKSEVWLPAAGWNGKFLAVGNGAWGGSIQYGALGALFYAALLERWPRPRPAGAPRWQRFRGLFAAALAAAAGWGDEVVQGILPNRVYDLRDVVLNALSGALVVIVLATRRWLRERSALAARPAGQQPGA